MDEGVACDARPRVRHEWLDSVSHVCAAGGQKGMRGASRASRNRTAKTSLDEFKINRRKEESEVLRELCGETDEIGETRASWPR